MPREHNILFKSLNDTKFPSVTLISSFGTIHDITELTKIQIELQESNSNLEERIEDPYKLIEDIPDGTYLLCYEKSSEPCHRHLLRDWVYDKTGYRIEEWKNDKEQKEADQQGIVDDLLEL